MFIAIVAASYCAGPDAGVGGMLAGFDSAWRASLRARGAGVRGVSLSRRAAVCLPAVFPLALAAGARAAASTMPGMWVDKWLMWFAPERVVASAAWLVSYPDYDSAFFLASLTIVPSMAVFVVNVETRFFDRYHQFYREIGAHATLARIRDNQLGCSWRCSLGRGSWCCHRSGWCGPPRAGAGIFTRSTSVRTDRHLPHHRVGRAVPVVSFCC